MSSAPPCRLLMTRIRAQIQAFAADLTTLVRRAALEAVTSAIGGAASAAPVRVAAKRGRGRPRKVAAPAAAPAKAPRGAASAKAAKRAPAAKAPSAKKASAAKRAPGEKRPPGERQAGRAAPRLHQGSSRSAHGGDRQGPRDTDEGPHPPRQEAPRGEEDPDPGREAGDRVLRCLTSGTAASAVPHDVPPRVPPSVRHKAVARIEAREERLRVQRGLPGGVRRRRGAPVGCLYRPRVAQLRAPWEHAGG